MCGIAGFVSETQGRAPDMRAPLDVLSHRGPDDTDWVRVRNVSLGHRRLAILDRTQAGRQPMTSGDGRFTVVYNGEIYNYRELRSELQRLGCHFHTQTDTEVLLQCFAVWGAAALTRFVGMFALALFDRDARTLLLARDGFGIKPLYYAQTSEGLGFASEIKALARWLPLRRTVNVQRVFDYLRHGWTDHGEETMWAEIRQIPAAHAMTIDLDAPGRPSLVRYWRPSGDVLDISFEDAVERVRASFLDGVRLHLRSDVPLGAALSGGIDSSAILCAMRHVDPHAELHAISYIAEGSGLSEERWIDLVASHTGARVHKVRIEPGEFASDLDDLVGAQDEPFVSTSIYAQWRVFRKAREAGLKVLLDGQGADELFAGYRQHVPMRLASLLRQRHWGEAWSLARGQSSLPGAASPAALLLQSLRRMAGDSRALRWLESMRLPRWLDRRWLRERGIVTHGLPASRRRDVLREQLEHAVWSTSLPMLLRYEDRNAMAASIESRVPFLTPAFAELALRLPEAHLLAADGTSKRVLRRALRGIVPDAVLARRDKIAFATPEPAWLRVLAPVVDAMLSGPTLSRIPMLDASEVRRQWRAMCQGKARLDARVWRWVNLIQWVERFGLEFH
jgi:asparagine synthase (glutamine-hydrolysing)